MNNRSPKRVLLTLLIASTLGGVIVTDAFAQARSSERRASSRQSAKPEAIFPAATREEPSVKSNPKNVKALNKMFNAYQKDDFEGTAVAAQEVLALDNINAYERAVAAQLAAQAAYNTDDTAGAKQYLQQAVEANGLDNNGHLQSLLMLAQLQLQDEEYEIGLANLDKFFAESGSTRAQDYLIKGQALYQMERYAEAIPVLQNAIASTETPNDQWSQLLMAAYMGAEQPVEAIKIAKQLADAKPDDKRAQINLATAYSQNDQMDLAAEVMERLRAAGQLTEEREYKQLFSIYANTENKEAKTVEVIRDGLDKGVLKDGDYQVWLALAQSYYYIDKIPEAIDAWKKAAPLSPNGETYLNLARVLHGEGRIPEAREAARQAQAKGGLRKPEDAQKIINLK